MGMMPAAEIEHAIQKHGSRRAAAKALGVPESTLRCRQNQKPPKATASAPEAEISGDDKACVLTLKTSTIRTLDAALATGHVDLNVWDVERWVLNKWDMMAKVAVTEGTGPERCRSEHLEATELWQVKVWFRKKQPVEQSIASLLKKIEAKSPICRRFTFKPTKGTLRRALEICIMDPHLGMQCHPPAADKSWSMEECSEMYLWALESLLAMSKVHGPFEQIMFPFGNDYLHADNVFHTTTAGTGQPEMVSYHHAYEGGETLAITAVERMKREAKVQVIQVPGNHDRVTSYTLGRVLRAYYHRDDNVSVDAGSSPYKFWRYGANLVGLEHGHSIAAVRLAALMANECPDDWAATKGGYREWHLGDQHRKGSAKPSAFEEQGVSVEYIAGLTPPNEWHRLKGYNWQKRGAVAYVWDYDLGPVARLQVNVNSWTGKPMTRAA